jgi:hypothetical protein
MSISSAQRYYVGVVVMSLQLCRRYVWRTARNDENRYIREFNRLSGQLSKMGAANADRACVARFHEEWYKLAHLPPEAAPNGLGADPARTKRGERELNSLTLDALSEWALVRSCLTPHRSQCHQQSSSGAPDG